MPLPLVFCARGRCRLKVRCDACHVLILGAHCPPPFACRAAAAAAAAGKKGAVCAVLQQRGYPPARVEAMLSQPGAFRLWEGR